MSTYADKFNALLKKLGEKSNTKTCTHPMERIMEYDGAYHCFACRTIWNNKNDYDEMRKTSL